MFAVLVLSLAGAAIAQDDFFNAYGYTKAMANCFGDDIYYGYLAEIANAERQCSGFQGNFASFAPSPVLTTIFNSLGSPSQAGFPGQVFVTSPPPVLSGKKKRQATSGPFFDAVALTDAISKVQSAVGNFTCVLRQLNAIDNNWNINYAVLADNYNRVNIDPNLRNDLFNGLAFCRDFSTCLPVEKLRSPLPNQLQRLMAFTKCEKRSRLAACFKQDLRRNINQFDLSVLPLGRGGPRPDILEQLMTILIGSESTDDLRLF